MELSLWGWIASGGEERRQSPRGGVVGDGRVLGGNQKSNGNDNKFVGLWHMLSLLGDIKAIDRVSPHTKFQYAPNQTANKSLPRLAEGVASLRAHSVYLFGIRLRWGRQTTGAATTPPPDNGCLVAHQGSVWPPLSGVRAKVIPPG